MGVWVGPRAVLQGAENFTPPRFEHRTIQPLYRLRCPVARVIELYVSDGLESKLKVMWPAL